MFDIETIKLGKFIKYRLLNIDSGERVSLISGFGGNVTEIVLNKNGTEHSIIEGLSDDEITAGNKRFKSTKLIPFPNRIENGRYAFNGKSYQLPINYETHAVHGLIMDKTLEVLGTETDNNQALIKLRYCYDGSIPGYPFRYEAIITYSLLKERGFACDTDITNVDSVPLPIGNGWHPYFRTKGKVDKLQIKIPSEFRIEVNELIPTGKLIPEEYPDAVAIGKKKYDTGFVLAAKGGRISTEVYDPELDIKIVVWQETGNRKYDYLQVFIPEDRNSIAIEPMSCAANAFNNKMGLIVLKPGQSFNASYGVYLE